MLWFSLTLLLRHKYTLNDSCDSPHSCNHTHTCTHTHAHRSTCTHARTHCTSHILYHALRSHFLRTLVQKCTVKMARNSAPVSSKEYTCTCTVQLKDMCTLWLHNCWQHTPFLCMDKQQTMLTSGASYMHVICATLLSTRPCKCRLPIWDRHHMGGDLVC